MHSEHTLKLANGLAFHYYDSGAPSGSTDYTTLVGFHGLGFNSDGFEHVHLYAHQNNLRTIFVNRRDYKGSTPYSDGEVADIQAGNETAYGLDVARVLGHFIDAGVVGSGGILVMGWSLGNLWTLSFLGNPGVIPRDLYEKIQPHLRSVIVYGQFVYPPHVILGLTYDQDWNPFIDPESFSQGPLHATQLFARWVSGHFAHPEAGIAPSGPQWTKETTEFTVDKWSSEEMARWFEPAAVLHCQHITPATLSRFQESAVAQIQRAVFDASSAASYFPNTSVLYISGANTIPSCLYGHREFARRVKDGEAARRVKLALIPGGNHFLHYEMPEVFVKEIVERCRAD
ncbi:AB hydrolase-1 domain-containing protein [Mycena chlorophos]|uniref:AB hydrolase-1 domain-containing protein n=1 Tax=Mycena chlorophos TaxID=658473 RepID=A0A8H6VUA3_MYCCL|nr:AB hydrolase-1 domain-containing protein [Mycena chlorophos]